MKKFLLFLSVFLFSVWQIFATLEVKTNLASWEYTFPIEIHLITNEKNAKIFYYTDGIGRMDSILEYQKPILLKTNTTLDFFATTKDFQDTPIQTANYSFIYTDKIQLILKNDTIILKNTDSDIQNIWYWKIESDTLNYELPPNTFLEANQSFSLDYSLKNNQKVFLFSPDKKEKKQEIYKIPEVQNEEKLEWEKNTYTPEENKNNVFSWSGEENIPIKEHTLEIEESFSPSKEEDFKISQELTASIWEKKIIGNSLFLFLFYILSIIILSIISYNIYLTHKKYLKTHILIQKNKKKYK